MSETYPIEVNAQDLMSAPDEPFMVRRGDEFHDLRLWVCCRRCRREFPKTERVCPWGCWENED